MFLLHQNDYDKVLSHIKEVMINNLFARSVVERIIPGKVFVDNYTNPGTFFIVHPYGMSLLFGNSTNADFNSKFLQYSLNLDKSRNKHEWMQAFPDQWEGVLKDLYSGYLINSHDNTDNRETGIIELNTRVLFKFNRSRYFNTKINVFPDNCQVVFTNEAIFNEMPGAVIPRNFWDSYNDFSKMGAGFSVLHNHEIASTAFSAYAIDNMLELGIESVPQYRGKGFAQIACSALIDFCLEKNLEPVWSCRLENKSSFILAEKLGFEVYKKLPYYRLSN